MKLWVVTHPPILHRFRDMVDYWSNFRPRQGVPLFEAFVKGEPYILDGQIWPQKLPSIEQCNACLTSA